MWLIAQKKLLQIIYNNYLTNIPKGGILNVSKEREEIKRKAYFSLAEETSDCGVGDGV